MSHNVDRYADHECDEGDECVVLRANAWMKSLELRGFPRYEIRDMRVALAAMTERVRELEDRVDTYVVTLAAVVARSGGRLHIKASELDAVGRVTLVTEEGSSADSVVLRLEGPGRRDGGGRERLS